MAESPSTMLANHNAVDTYILKYYFILAEYGLGQDVVLIEQGALGGGTATNATGLLGVLKQNHQETRIAMTSTELYR